MQEIRKEMYDYIIQNNLKNLIKERFGKNYTNVKTDDLKAFVQAHKDCTCKKKDCQSKDETTEKHRKFPSYFTKLLYILQKKKLLSSKEINLFNI